MSEEDINRPKEGRERMQGQEGNLVYLETSRWSCLAGICGTKRWTEDDAAKSRYVSGEERLHTGFCHPWGVNESLMGGSNKTKEPIRKYLWESYLLSHYKITKDDSEAKNLYWGLSPNIPLQKTSPRIIKGFQLINYNILSILILHLEVLSHWTAIDQFRNDTLLNFSL